MLNNCKKRFEKFVHDLYDYVIKKGIYIYREREREKQKL